MQLFKYELQILNYSKTLTKQERCQRFTDLLKMDFSKLEGGQQVDGQLIGAGLIWARASFDRKSNEQVQVNTWVKLTVEIFTKVKGNGVSLESVTTKFNESNFNFDVKDQSLTRDKPLVLVQDLYLDEQKLMNG